MVLPKNRIKEALALRRWTMTELADKLGVSQVAVSNWANHKREPKMSTILQIADLLDVSVGYLTGSDDPPQGLGAFDPQDPEWYKHPDAPALLLDLAEDPEFKGFMDDPESRSLLTGVAYLRGRKPRDFIKKFLSYTSYLNERERDDQDKQRDTR